MGRTPGSMPRALVVYTASDGSTKTAAVAIADGISRAGRVSTTVTSVEALLPGRVDGADIVVLGSAASGRAAVQELRRLAELVPAFALERKMVSVFDAGPQGRHGSGARRLRKGLLEADPALHLAAPGISLAVDPRSHELPEPELERCRQFGEHLADIAAAAGSA